MRVLIGMMRNGKLERTAIVAAIEVPELIKLGWIVVGRDPDDEAEENPPT